jgi:type 1 fimbria pilin
MKTLSLSLAVVAAIGLSVASTANAANNGKLILNGTLTNMTCDVGAGTGVSPGTNPGEINVDLGNVSFSDIGRYADNKLATATPIQLLVNCTAGAAQYNTVNMRFVARQGSGLDNLDNKLLRTTGAADGVGIGMLNSSFQLMDLSGNETTTRRWSSRAPTVRLPRSTSVRCTCSTARQPIREMPTASCRS